MSDIKTLRNIAIIVPIVTPGLLICLALGVSKQDTNMILSMSLVISGFATFLQCKKVGPFGAGLLIVQGTSFNFIGPIIGINSRSDDMVVNPTKAKQLTNVRASGTAILTLLIGSQSAIYLSLTLIVENLIIVALMLILAEH